MNVAVVWTAFIASLKVKTMVELIATLAALFAGTVEIMVGLAWTRSRHAAYRNNARQPPRSLPLVKRHKEFI